jgi:two-component system sensor histidine kinase ChiS
MRLPGSGLPAVHPMILRARLVTVAYQLSKGDRRFASRLRRGEARVHMPMLNQTIVVIDDEQSFCDVVAEILRSFGYEVHTAYSVEQAIPLLEQHDTTLIILDIMMPGIDGLTFIRHLRTRDRFAELPIIISSAKFLESDRTAALEAGANLYLPKPFSAGDLRQAIETLLQTVSSS